MNQNLQTLLDAIAEARTSAHLSRYLPRLQSEPGDACLLLYVTQPRFPEPGNDVSEYVTVETPVEIGLRLLGGLRAEEIIGIFPLQQAAQAVAQAEKALAEALAAGGENKVAPTA